MKNLTRRSWNFSSKFTVGEVKRKDPKDARVLLGTLTGCLEFVLIGLSHGMKWQCYQSPNMSVILKRQACVVWEENVECVLVRCEGALLHTRNQMVAFVVSTRHLTSSPQLSSLPLREAIAGPAEIGVSIHQNPLLEPASLARETLTAVGLSSVPRMLSQTPCHSNVTQTWRAPAVAAKLPVLACLASKGA
ncbi:hypothetical protein BGZ61DRAFT_441839 [Ilyonectria robusta]|uniref:uncharacterized protein n=1 Tax=Ilyonectria robusta TaxID=1079257 RepID=UPI001E8ED64B|nr:uncharacterized protein BGZ61DRAFT_441839 [Ilyonectria robusta]KAH8736329.1 hypothetical protein BGZ61DRAFT_441839 [Ilyonectria robusta]